MNRRIKKTKKSIINTFLELRSKKPIEKITVKELCDKAEINKSTFYTYFKDIYDLSEHLESQIANEVIAGLQHKDYIFSKPDIFIRELAYAYTAQENLINILFSGSRSNLLLMRIESSLKDVIFSQHPDYKDNIAFNVLFTFSVYGGYYAFDKCRHFGKEAVIDNLSIINREIMKYLL